MSFLLSSLLLAPALMAPGPQTGELLRTLGPAPLRYAWDVLTPGNTGVLGDFTQTIFVDSSDSAWVAAYDPVHGQGGMSNFDGQRWRPLSNVDPPVLQSPVFHDIVADIAGVMWIGTDAGLVRYDPVVGPSSLKRYDAGNSPLPANQVRDLDLDPLGRIWMATGETGGGSGGGLARFDPLTGEWRAWDSTSGLPWGPQWPGWNRVDHVAVVPEPNGGFSVWFHGLNGMATWKNGVFSWFGVPVLGGETTPRTFMSNDPVDEQGNMWLQTSNGLARRAPDGTFTVTGYPAGLGTEVSCVFAFSGGRAALGTYYSDVFEWDGAWNYLGNWAGSTFGSGAHTYVLSEDTQGHLWAGGIGGAAKRTNGAWQRFRLSNTGMVGYSVQEIAFDYADNVLMNGNHAPGVGGFSLFDGTDWTCVNDFNYGLGPAWGIASDEVRALCPRMNGTVAVAPAAQGLYQWDGVLFTELLQTGYSIVDLVEDGLGRLWAARDYGYGVFLIDGSQSQEFFLGNSPYLGGRMTELIADPEPGYVWIVGLLGLHRTNGVSWDVYPKEQMGLTSSSTGSQLTCGARAADGTLWLGSGEGLIHFDPASETFETMTPANSALPSDDIDQVIVAPDQSVWCSSSDAYWPYPGGVTHFVGPRSTTFTPSGSSLPFGQVQELAVRPSGRFYEVWVGTSMGGVGIVRPSPKRIRNR